MKKNPFPSRSCTCLFVRVISWMRTTMTTSPGMISCGTRLDFLQAPAPTDTTTARSSALRYDPSGRSISPTLVTRGTTYTRMCFPSARTGGAWMIPGTRARS